MRFIAACLLSLVAAANAGFYGISTYASTSVTITEFSMDFNVPPLPAQKSGTLFIWPGLQPLGGAAHFDPIDNGVLQPVLTYGGSCAPNQPPEISSHPYDSWWISGQYVNTYGHQPGYTGCHGGAVMAVPVGDWLHVNMSLTGDHRTWIQSITSKTTGRTVSYSIDMQGQSQNWAEFQFENYGDFTPAPAWNIRNIVIRTWPNDANLCKQIYYPGDGRASCHGISTGSGWCYMQGCDFKGGFPLHTEATLETFVRARTSSAEASSL